MDMQESHPPIRSFRDLIVWQRARELAGAAKKLCDGLNLRRQSSLVDEILRAGASIPGNIAEGRGRLSKADNVRHLVIALGSLNELESHVELACDWGWVTVDSTRTFRGLASEVGRMLNAQIRALGRRRLR
jgi:four helix bundle protein